MQGEFMQWSVHALGNLGWQHLIVFSIFPSNILRSSSFLFFFLLVWVVFLLDFETMKVRGEVQLPLRCAAIPAAVHFKT